MTFHHIIFDCDGVLVDSEPLSMRVDVQILAENGVVMDEAEAHHRFVGKTFAAMVDDISREFGVRFPPDTSAQKDRRLLELYARELKPVDGTSDMLRAIGMPAYSVASNSPAERVTVALQITGLTEFFADRITTFEHVARAKPEPDVFIEAARRAGFAPQHCIVVEDSVTGVTAAARAGCRVLGFTGTHSQPETHAGVLKAAGAEQIFNNMACLPALVSPLLGGVEGKL
jgi:HAD superfamily hydrolase (TIGR01509 family)